MCQLACRCWIEGRRYVASLETLAWLGFGTSEEVVQQYLSSCPQRISLLGKWVSLDWYNVQVMRLLTRNRSTAESSEESSSLQNRYND